jgi:hypothetical protein
MIDIVLEILKLASVGLVAGLFSSVLANRDHRQRKWWEMRVTAYQNAIEALSDLIYYYDRHYKVMIESRMLFDEIQKRLDEHWEQTFPKVRKFADSGAFLFSEEANAALRKLINNDDEQSYEEYIENHLEKARECLNQLVKCSKIDLKLKPSLMERLF